MSDERDPIEAESDGSRDLYDIVTWEPRTGLDRLALRVHKGLHTSFRAIVVVSAVVLLIGQFVLTGLASVRNPIIGLYVLISVLPALLLVAIIWKIDVTVREPLDLLGLTFLLGVLFASFAGLANSLAQPFFEYVPIVGLALFFLIIVGPIEESIKLLAVRLYAYRSDAFGAVIDGAVYGAVAGLGFATIENTIYIGEGFVSTVNTAALSPGQTTFSIAAFRTLAGPGHVIYSAIAGYYLGLAKFNRQHAGPIIIKGLLLAAGIHAVYNITVSYLPDLITVLALSLSPVVAFFGFVIVFDGVIGYWLYRKLMRYQDVYQSTVSNSTDSTDSDQLEFDFVGGSQDPRMDAVTEPSTDSRQDES